MGWRMGRGKWRNMMISLEWIRRGERGGRSKEDCREDMKCQKMSPKYGGILIEDMWGAKERVDERTPRQRKDETR